MTHVAIQGGPAPEPPIDVDRERPLAITPEQRRQFDEDGFFLIEDLLSPAENDELLTIVDEQYAALKRERDLGDEAFQMRNIVAMHRRFRDMLTHPRMLPLVVDVMGTNIQLRTSHADVRPPQPATDGDKPLGAPDGFFPWHSDAPMHGWPLVDGVVPFMEMKVGIYLTDLSGGHRGEICVVRGSHRRRQPRNEKIGDLIVDEDDIVPVTVKPGTALVWRTALIHALRPNLSDTPRRCLYYGFHPRWIRPSDYDRQTEQTLADCTPVERQLLGELGTGSRNYAGDDPLVHPVSLYWRPTDDVIPLKAWADAQRERLHGSSD